MGKEKGNKTCTVCGDSLEDEDIFHHMHGNYCYECMAVHIKKEHVTDVAERVRFSPEGKRASTYKSI